MSNAADGHLAVSVWVRLLKAHGLVMRELRRRVPCTAPAPRVALERELSRRPPGLT